MSTCQLSPSTLCFLRAGSTNPQVQQRALHFETFDDSGAQRCQAGCRAVVEAFEGDKSETHKALTLIAGDKLTFDERVVHYRVAGLETSATGTR